jgi:hypothetical protein
VRDFDKRTGELTIGKDKAGHARRIVIPEAASRLLAEQAKDKLPTAPLFMREVGAPWDRHTWKAPREAAAAAKLPPETTAYTLRHSTITDLVMAGFLDEDQPPQMRLVRLRGDVPVAHRFWCVHMSRSVDTLTRA